ncbi:MAG: restriction endonuclease subunit S, partial [Methylomicrobium sp.]|nr:restriction endonuclease subunit S [Methylomicrobium sp.]
MNRVQLESVATVNPRLPRDIDESQNVTFLPMAAVSEDGQILEEETRVLSDTKKGFTYFERGDVLLAKITPCFENGKAAYIEHMSHQVGFGSTEFHVVRPDVEQLDGKYLFYLLWNPALRFVGERNMTGSAGQKRVPADFLKRVEIPLPPLPEQKRIAAILDKADAIRRKRQQAIQLADEFLRSVFL